MRSVTNYFMPNGVPTSVTRTLPEPEIVTGRGPDYALNPNLVPKAWYSDPWNMVNSMGLGYQEGPTALGYQTLKQMAENDVTVASIIQLRMHQVASFCLPQRNRYSIGYRIVHRDPKRKLSEGELNECRRLEDFMAQGGDVEIEGNDLPTCAKRLVRDRLTYDQACLETMYNMGGRPYSFFHVPGASIRMLMPKHKRGTPLIGEEMERDERYGQVLNNRLVETFTPRELAFSVANPRTDIGSYSYGMSELEVLIMSVTRHLFAEQWNTNAFSQGSTTKGILNIKGNMTPQAMQDFRAQWMAQVSGVTNAWRTPLINSKEDLQWLSLQPTNQEMGYQEWIQYLVKNICAVFLVDPAELNIETRSVGGNAPMFMSSNEAQQKLSQDRGLRPILRQLQDLFNRHVIRRFDKCWMFEYVGLDAKTEEQAIELRLKELQSYKTLNEVRATEQLPPVEFGDIVPNPTYIGYRNQKELLAAQQGAQGGPPAGGGQEEGPQPGSQEAKLQGKIKGAVGGVGAMELKVPDRMRGVQEDWEDNYNASLPQADLVKAMGPLYALLEE